MILINVNQYWHITYTVINFRESLFALPVLQAGGDAMSFADIAILLGLLGGCIYATISVTLKILEYLQKKKD